MEAEAIAELSDINRPKRTYGILEQEMNKDFFLKTILFTVAYLPSFISAKLLARRIELKLLRPALHRLFDKHGVDGLILYFVKPPKTIGALETILWERYMLKQGFLSPTGGLTDIGVAYLRGVLPKEEILKRAEEMKRRYEKLALPEQTKEEIFRKTEEMNI
jgi:hypothetical protein